MPPKQKMPKQRLARKRKVFGAGGDDDADEENVCNVSDMFNTFEKQGKTYLEPECFPSYIEDDIWSVLQECGFEYVSGFRNKDMDIKGLDHESDIRKHLCLSGIPNTKDVEDEDDVIALKKWVAFANVPLKISDSTKVLKSLALPSDIAALKMLEKLGFQLDEETNKISRDRPLAVGGTDEYKSISAIRNFIRSADDDTLLATAQNDETFSPRKRARRTTRKNDMPLEDDELLALRLWGALSPTPFPVYGEAEQGSDDEDEDDEKEILPSEASSGSQCIIL